MTIDKKADFDEKMKKGPFFWKGNELLWKTSLHRFFYPHKYELQQGQVTNGRLLI